MKKAHTKLLQQISGRIPKELLGKLMHKVQTRPNVVALWDLALNDPDFPEEKKQVIRNLMELNVLAETEEVDRDVEMQIDQFINDEILKEIKLGNLPKNKFKHLYEKGRSKKNLRKHTEASSGVGNNGNVRD